RRTRLGDGGDARGRLHDRRRRTAAARRRSRRDGFVHDHPLADRRLGCRAVLALRVDDSRADRARRRYARAGMRSRFLEGAGMIAPVGVAAFLFALSFGVLARAAGMGLAAPLVMSATTFAGSAQFAVASVLGSAGSAGAADAAAAVIDGPPAPLAVIS